NLLLWLLLLFLLRLRRRSRRATAATAYPGRQTIGVLVRIMWPVQGLDEKLLARQVGNVVLERAQSRLASAGRHGARSAVLWPVGGIGLDGEEGLDAFLSARQLGNIHRLVGIDHIGRGHLDAIDAGDAVKLAGLFIVHAVGIAAQG